MNFEVVVMDEPVVDVAVVVVETTKVKLSLQHEIVSTVEKEDILPINVNLAKMRMMIKMTMNQNLLPRK